ncbi:hypothetical protein CEXT_640741 [Caerostris extrusa]|uniref:Uncharacterized protein n=1 Tax=Caerostris extrusa TaxID=172846 RepID=A0AAV4MUS8_CAEEX|nr:hypothetical protein CEXT_640741 [Caerostris extrusa]
MTESFERLMSIVPQTNGFCLCLMRNRKSAGKSPMLGNCNRNCAPKIDKDCEGIIFGFLGGDRKMGRGGMVGGRFEVKWDREIVFKTTQFRGNDLRFSCRERVLLCKEGNNGRRFGLDGIYFVG